MDKGSMRRKEAASFLGEAGLNGEERMSSIVSWIILDDFWSICTHNLLILSSVSMALSPKCKIKQIPRERKPDKKNPCEDALGIIKQ